MGELEPEVMPMTMAPGCGEISGRWRLTVIEDETPDLFEARR